MREPWRETGGGLDLPDAGRGDRREQFELGGQWNRRLDLQTVTQGDLADGDMGVQIAHSLLGQGGQFFGTQAQQLAVHPLLCWRAGPDRRVNPTRALGEHRNDTGAQECGRSVPVVFDEHPRARNCGSLTTSATVLMGLAITPASLRVSMMSFGLAGCRPPR